jgi:hypothetical protein
VEIEEKVKASLGLKDAAAVAVVGAEDGDEGEEDGD